MDQSPHRWTRPSFPVLIGAVALALFAAYSFFHARPPPRAGFAHQHATTSPSAHNSNSFGFNPAPLPTVLDAQDALTEALRRAGVVVNEGNSMQVMEQTMYYAMVAQQEWIRTICETGFNGGHSSVTWLSSSWDATLFSWDLPHPDYGPPARAHVNRTFPGRFYITDGDSTITLPGFHKANPDLRCDIIHVDGGHSYEVAIADLRNFYHMASRRRHIVLMDDLRCRGVYCIEPMKAWDQAVTEGWLRERACYTKTDGWRGWCAGEYVFQDYE
ncbi:hypothetical protein M427DRAFT_135614 [Gonapodya prolifera JEL478]|uniref:Uncharacterized protein n=1 Tax=Gonapodya prolifera (strain JEL478) TaxID=1344416 RepID=A0A139AD22_GONPJ|nr:hypothetical protein M427DRAFT_135614 [Gonapodya prolifera JEL478]|eukprot:KXS14712.1 hypothetical protein M427DRAFT_135614 [Gonapodya prolifera JEL478]